MSERDGLRALQMGIARHHRVDIAPGDTDEGAAQGGDPFFDLADLIAQVKPEVEGDLVVARTGGVKLPAGIADYCDEPAFDREMDVLVGDVEAESARIDIALDAPEPALDCARLRDLDQSDARQHPRMRDRTHDVMAVEPAVEGQRRCERLDFGQARAAEAPANQVARSGRPGGPRTHRGDSASARRTCRGSGVARESETAIGPGRLFIRDAGCGRDIRGPRNWLCRRDG